MGVWAYGDLTARECGKSKGNRMGRHWGVLRAGLNGVAWARGHNARDRAIRTGRTKGVRVRKADVTGGSIRLVLLDIRTGRAGELETILWELHQGNVDVGFLSETNLTQGIHTRNDGSVSLFNTYVAS